MTRPALPMRYLSGYPAQLVADVTQRIETGTLGQWLQQRYPEAHVVRNERALREYVQQIKDEWLRSTPPLSRIAYANDIHAVHQALGTHTTISRVQGARLKASRELRISTVFRLMPEPFLRMIVVHELAHLREREHDKAFYKLCCHMEPAYHQLEFEVRAYLCWLESTGESLWV